MNELRWDPSLEKWVIVASRCQKRPLLPTYCPFCPGAKEIPRRFDVMTLPNKFPSLSPKETAPKHRSMGLYRKAAAKGICEVIVYCPQHQKSLAKQPLKQIVKLIDLWKKRYKILGRKKFIKYVFIFENKGKEIGITLTHPHGQIYAFPFIPPIIQTELDAGKRYKKKHKRCLFCSILKRELKDKRIVYCNDNFVAFVPFYASWPYEVHLYSRRHFGSLSDLTDNEKLALAEALKVMIQKYNRLFGFELPYTMVLHQTPTDEKNYSHYHFHIEFYPLHRAKDKLKYRAGVETGAGVFINPCSPEEKAEELRNLR